MSSYPDFKMSLEIKVFLMTAKPESRRTADFRAEKEYGKILHQRCTYLRELFCMTSSCWCVEWNLETTVGNTHLFFLCFSWWCGWRTQCWTSPASAPDTPLKPELAHLQYPQVIGSSQNILGMRMPSLEAHGSLQKQNKPVLKLNKDQYSEISFDYKLWLQYIQN